MGTGLVCGLQTYELCILKSPMCNLEVTTLTAHCQGPALHLGSCRCVPVAFVAHVILVVARKSIGYLIVYTFNVHDGEVES
jgi:hypothetical protein